MTRNQNSDSGIRTSGICETAATRIRLGKQAGRPSRQAGLIAKVVEDYRIRGSPFYSFIPLGAIRATLDLLSLANSSTKKW
jgi:hypothetical protein